MLTCLGSTSAYLASVARIPFVAGIDHLLPKAFGRLHPRYGTPANALITQTAIAMVFAVLGQAGGDRQGSVRGAGQHDGDYHDAAVPGHIRGGDPPVTRRGYRAGGTNPRRSHHRACLRRDGHLTTLLAITLSLVPRADEPDKLLAASKVIGLTVLLLGSGGAVYWNGMRRRARLLRTSGPETASWEGSTTPV